MNVFSLIGEIVIDYAKADKALSNVSTKSDAAASSLKKADSNSSTFAKSLQTLGDKCTSVGKALAPLSAAAGVALGAAVVGASNFTDGMAKMSTLFDTTKVSVSDLSNQFLDLSNKTGIGATELAEAGYQALSAGVNVEQVGTFVETAGNLAKAGFTSTTTAVDVLTTAMNAYGDSAGTADEIANKLVRTQNLGKTTVDELASAMGKVIPTASSMGVGIDQLCSGYVSLTKQGIATAEATTYMNSMFNELGDSGTTLGGIIKDKTGMSFQECMNSGMSLADVLQVTKQYADENGIAYNELWSSAEAGKAGLAILNGGVEEFNETAETMASDTDDVSEALEKLETPSVKAKKALNQIKNSGIELGESMLGALEPAIEGIANGVENLTNWFNSLGSGTQTTIGIVLAVVTTLAPTLLFVGKLAGSISTLITTLGPLVGITTEASASTGILGSVLGALTGPVGLVIAAIAGFIAAIVALYNSNEDFRNKVNFIWESIKSKISSVIDSIGQLFDAFMSLVQSLWQSCGDSIVNVVTNAFNLVANVVQTALDLIKAIIDTFTAILNGDWQGAWDGICNIVSIAWTGIQTFISNGINLASSVISAGLTVISTVFSTIWNTIKSIVSSVWEGIKSTISNGINAAKGVIDSVLSAIGNKFTSIFEGAKNTVSNAISTIKGMFNFSWSLPHISLPHFSVSGGEAPWGFMGKGSLPSVSVSWYKKAMEGMIMDVPTIFGMDKQGNLMAGGEAGSETVVGTENLMAMISQASNQRSDEIIELLIKIVYLLAPDTMKETIKEAVEGLENTVDGRTFGRLVRKYA